MDNYDAKQVTLLAPQNANERELGILFHTESGGGYAALKEDDVVLVPHKPNISLYYAVHPAYHCR